MFFVRRILNEFTNLPRISIKRLYRSQKHFAWAWSCWRFSAFCIIEHGTRVTVPSAEHNLHRSSQTKKSIIEIHRHKLKHSKHKLNVINSWMGLEMQATWMKSTCVRIDEIFTGNVLEFPRNRKTVLLWIKLEDWRNDVWLYVYLNSRAIAVWKCRWILRN